MELVVEVSGEARTSTEIIAKGVEIRHKNVLALARKYLPLLAELGRVAFETRPFQTKGGCQQREFALLNERQATFLITLMRNTEKVVEFKFRLVKQFYEMATLLAKRAALAVRREFLEQTNRASLEHSRPFGSGLARRRIEKASIESEMSLLDIQLRLGF